MKIRCKRGHLYTPENTRIATDGSRKCRACDRERKEIQKVIESVATPTDWGVEHPKSYGQCHFCKCQILNPTNQPTPGASFVKNEFWREWTPANSVPCCTVCERMKGPMTSQEFRNHVRKIL